jgi:hypothetical protein
MTGFSLPTSPITTAGGAAVLELDTVAAQPTLDIFRGLAPMPGAPGGGAGSAGGTLAPAAVEVSVLNGTGIDGQAGAAADGLRGYGFVVDQVGDAGTDAQVHTALKYPPGQKAAAELVAHSLRNTAELVEDSGTTSGVVLVTGADFAGVTQAPATTTPASGAGGDTGDAGDRGTTTTRAPSPDEVTSTTHIGFAPGDPPPGVSCG